MRSCSTPTGWWFDADWQGGILVRKGTGRGSFKDLVGVSGEAMDKGMARAFELHKRVRPAFSSSWLDPVPPEEGEVICQYSVGTTEVSVYHVPGEGENHYHLRPLEYRLPRRYIEVLCRAMGELDGLHVTSDSIEDTEQMRGYVEEAGERIISRLLEDAGIDLGKDRTTGMERTRQMTDILARYTTGFGVLEHFLVDKNIQDIYVDAPSESTGVYVTMGSHPSPLWYGKCRTNLRVGPEDMSGALSRLRYISGRPFSEAMPVLETDIPAFNTRATVVGNPISQHGLGFALRRHSVEPWTLLRLIDVGSITPLAAGLISFLIDGNSTIMVAGSRGAGKSSLLGAMLFEIPKSQRIITIEDTKELPVEGLQESGYKVQSITVEPGVQEGRLDMNDALVISLRLGESVLVLGEARGQEVRTLYEAMRVGTAGSSVMGTFHADSARSVYERVVYDMGVPPKSFSATDVVIVAGLKRPAGSQIRRRRVVQIAELIKDSEGEFRNMMEYSAGAGGLVSTDFLNSSGKVREIAEDWGISLDDALAGIRVRGDVRGHVVDRSREWKKPELLGCAWVSRYNSKFWELVERHQGAGGMDNDAIKAEWLEWFDRSARYG